MAIQEKHPHHHFALLPFMAQGHMIPMVDIARLLAKRGVTITILITPYNHSRIKSTIDRAITAGSIINISHLKFPNVEAGLPQECESLNMVSSLDESFKFFKAASMLESQVEETLQSLKPHPTCLISDMCYPWTNNVAAKLGIPRVAFHGTSCFSLVCFYMIGVSKDFEDIGSDTEYFVVPGLPNRIEINKAQIRGSANQVSYEWDEIRNQIRDGDAEAFGTVANTFDFIPLDGQTSHGPFGIFN